MMREGKSALRLLLKLQAARQAIEGDEATASRAAWAEHSAVGMMQEALGPAPAWPDRSASPPKPALEKFSLVSNISTNSHTSRIETQPRRRAPAVQAVSGSARPWMADPQP